ncbi:MAG: guanylate kinase [Verrucomicrobia bacterium TMED60]|jgi:guanylate kinase|nr:MAG: guanylate kinase [Verrucomicrobia bacterium TMED60]|tara:strand:- start:1508 stop:2110 length:603 start_codon:yes stop_codon:yes gene_type:complete
MVGYLLLISGPAGVGKTTICDRLLHEFYPKLVRVVTATSRKPRPGEQNGTDYLFFSKSEFIEKIHNQKFIEHEIIHGNYYGTLKHSLINIDKDVNLLMNIDVNGAESIQTQISTIENCNLKCRSIFIRPNSIEQLKQRLKHRGTDDSQEIEKRLDTAFEEIKVADRFDVIIDTSTKEEDYSLVKAQYLNLNQELEEEPLN